MPVYRGSLHIENGKIIWLQISACRCHLKRWRTLSIAQQNKTNTQDDWHKRTSSVDPVLLLHLMGLFRGVGGARGSGVGLLPNLHRHGHKSKRDGHHGVRGVPKTCELVQVMGVAQAFFNITWAEERSECLPDPEFFAWVLSFLLEFWFFSWVLSFLIVIFGQFFKTLNIFGKNYVKLVEIENIC